MPETPTRSHSPMDGDAPAVLRRRGFPAFLLTQFLGALNDNAFKIVVSLTVLSLSGTAATQGGAEGQALLGITGAVFVLPFLLFSGLGGQLADRFDKRRVLIVTKALETPAMLLAFVGLALGSVPLLLATLFLLSTQSAFFGPAKYGILPEIFAPRALTAANALVQMTTMLAIILGTVLGGYLVAASGGASGIIVLVLVGIAVAGLVSAFGIPRVAAPDKAQRPPLRFAPWAGLAAGASVLRREPALRLAIFASSWFWGSAALVTLALLAFATQVLGLSDARAGELQAAVGVGIAIGAALASRLSAGRIELGLVPLGASLILLCLLAVPGAGGFISAAVPLVLLGVGAGLYLVPMEAFVQANCDPAERGRVMGLAAVLDAAAMLAGSLAMAGLGALGLTPAAILLAAALSMAVPLFFAWRKLAVPAASLLLRLLLRVLFRLRVTGLDHLPKSGGALLVANHVSYWDAVLIAAICPRPVRFISNNVHYAMPVLRRFMRANRAISIEAGNRRSVIAALASARSAIEAGEVVCIFPEGGLSRSGAMLPFQRGAERIVAGTAIPTVPVALHGLWGVAGSWSFGRMVTLRKLLHLAFARRRVAIGFGAPVRPEQATAAELRARLAVQLSDLARAQMDPHALLHRRTVVSAKRHWRRPAIADTAGRDLTYGKLLIGLILLRGRLKPLLGPGRNVAVLLPASVAAVLVNVVLAMLGRTTVNLNFTAGPEAVRAALATAEVDTLITSRLFLAKAKLHDLVEAPGLRPALLLEDVLKDVGKGEKLRAAALALLTPAHLLAALLDSGRRDSSRIATVLFSSGTTGKPKGVVLSHANIFGVTDAATEALEIGPHYGFLGILPPFHAFGYTVLLWLPLLVGARCVYHANPLEGKAVAELVEKHRLTVVVTTPSFLSGWLRVADSRQFASVTHIVTGAEKLRADVAAKAEAALGIPILEGYGMTELAPAVAVSLPPVTRGDLTQIGRKPGSVGLPLPGVGFRIVDRNTMEDLPVGAEGMNLINGPGRMQGYLNDVERTEAALHAGWYITGDIGRLDEDGFLFVTDRVARFSKLGGEMVPHAAVEAALSELPGVEGAAVTGIPDAAKGERLIAFVTAEEGATLDPQALRSALNGAGLPNLWLPRADAIHLVDALPTLASGKVDLGALKAQALALHAKEPAPEPAPQG